MKPLWNGESLNWIYRILAGALAIATIVTIPFVAVTVDTEYSIPDLVLGTLCYAYLVLVFGCVSVRGKAPTGVLPWK
jgi:hypothetical protein